MTPSSHLNKDEHFDGEENPFIYSRFYDLTFNCDFQLERYPFDYQRCFIEVTAFSCVL